MKIKRNFDFLSGHSWYLPGWSGMITLLFLLLGGALIGSLICIGLQLILGDLWTNDYTTLVSYVMMFIPPMMYSHNKSMGNSAFETGYSLDSNNFGSLGGLKCALLAMVMTLAASYAAELPGAILPDMPEWLEDALSNLVEGKLWVSILSVSIFAPLFEEWLCRGTILRGLLHFKHKDKDGNEKEGIKPVWAIVASAAFFAFIHLNPWQAIPAFILGLLFGYVYYKTGSLKLTMLMHCTNNTFAVILSNIDSLKDVEGFMDVLPALPYAIIWLACAGIIYLTLKEFSKIKTQSPQGNCDILPE